MARGNIPVVQLRRLRGELRRARELAGHTQKQVAEALGWSLSKVIRQEAGAHNISTSDVMALVLYYNITDAKKVESLLAITRAKERVWWWDEYRDIHPKGFIEFLAYEDSATSIRQFQSLAVPGLAQTESYARTLFGVKEQPQVAELALQVRMRRQQILDRVNPTKVQFILDEAVIHRIVGGWDVMLEQLTHLRELNERPNVDIQIVPFTAGVNAAMRGSFTILEFFPLGDSTSAEIDYVVNLEEPNIEAIVHDNPETAGVYVELFFNIREMALSVDESNRLIEARIEGMRSSAA